MKKQVTTRGRCHLLLKAHVQGRRLRVRLVLAATAWTSGPGAFLRRLRVARLYGRRRLRRRGSRRTDNDFDEVSVTITTIDDGESWRVDSTRNYEIVPREIGRASCRER